MVSRDVRNFGKVSDAVEIPDMVAIVEILTVKILTVEILTVEILDMTVVEGIVVVVIQGMVVTIDLGIISIILSIAAAADTLVMKKNSSVANVAPKPAFCMPISSVNARRMGSGNRINVPPKYPDR